MGVLNRFFVARRLPQGGAKIQKNHNFCLLPKAPIGASETLRFSSNSATVFGELFSKIRFSKNLIQSRSKSVFSGANLVRFLRNMEGCIGRGEPIWFSSNSLSVWWHLFSKIILSLESGCTWTHIWGVGGGVGVGVTWYDIIWYDMLWYDMIYYDM